MSAIQLLIIVGFFIAFACVRFGLPICFCWLMGKADKHFIHPEPEV